MIHPIDGKLLDEARRFHLLFACPDCAAYDPDADRCSLGFPNEPHRDPSLVGREQVIFCKAFELR